MVGVGGDALQIHISDCRRVKSYLISVEVLVLYQCLFKHSFLHSMLNQDHDTWLNWRLRSVLLTAVITWYQLFYLLFLGFWKNLRICNFLEVPRFPAWFLRMLLVCVVLQAGHSWAGGSTEAYGTGRVWVTFWQGAGEDRDVSCISEPTRQVVSSAGVRYLKNPSVCWGFFFYYCTFSNKSGWIIFNTKYPNNNWFILSFIVAFLILCRM